MSTVETVEETPGLDLPELAEIGTPVIQPGDGLDNRSAARVTEFLNRVVTTNLLMESTASKPLQTRIKRNHKIILTSGNMIALDVWADALSSFVERAHIGFDDLLYKLMEETFDKISAVETGEDEESDEDD